MGHDICPIGRHNLDTSTLENFSRDIARRFNVNVEFGYWDEYSFNEDKSEFLARMDYITLGRIATDGAELTLDVFDNYYQIHALWQNHGDDLHTLPYFKRNAAQLDYFNEVRHKKWFEIIDKQADEEWGDAFNDTFHCRLFYYSRWWTFCRCFTTENEFDIDFSGLNAFRTKHMQFFEKIGGAQIVFVDDQGPHQDLVYNSYTWEYLLNECKTRFNNNFLSIPNFMLHKKLRPENDYPNAFYDDFSDIKNTRIEQDALA